MESGSMATLTDTMLPVPNSTESYWRSEPHWLDEHRSTTHLPAEADIVIIGTGIAGVSTAYHLVNNVDTNNDTSKPSILLLEARQVCSGATGRNGGHIKTLASKIGGLIAVHGKSNAEDIVQFVRANIYAVKRVIERERIDAEAELRRSFDVPLTEEDASVVTREFEELLQDGFPLMQDVGYVGERSAERVCPLQIYS
jgi:glycine/D-amino acid oxidase-like deaminating enzyme